METRLDSQEGMSTIHFDPPSGVVDRLQAPGFFVELAEHYLSIECLSYPIMLFFCFFFFLF